MGSPNIAQKSEILFCSFIPRLETLLSPLECKSTWLEHDVSTTHKVVKKPQTKRPHRCAPEVEEVNYLLIQEVWIITPHFRFGLFQRRSQKVLQMKKEANFSFKASSGSILQVFGVTTEADHVSHSHN